MIIILVIAVLVFLIVTHELGHFLFAKLFKVKVEEFGLGYPPRIFGVRRYKGKVAVSVEEVTEAGVDIEEKGGVEVEKITEITREVDILETKKNWRFFWRNDEPEDGRSGFKGGTVYSLNFLPFGGFVKIQGMADGEEETKGGTETDPRSFENQGALKRAAILAGGVLMNFMAGWLILTFVFMAGISPEIVVSGVSKGSPAASVGIEAGDTITNFSNSDKFISFIDQHRGQAITLGIDRQGKEINLSVVPRINPPQGEGALGVMFTQTGITPQPFFSALWNSLLQSLFLCWLVLETFGLLVAKLFTKASLLSGIVGPIGVFQVAEQTASLGWIFFFNLFALIALNLAVLNLLPLPALDGGHLLFIMIEKIKGSPVSKKIQGLVNRFGFAFLIVLMILVSIRDISHLF